MDSYVLLVTILASVSFTLTLSGLIYGIISHLCLCRYVHMDETTALIPWYTKANIMFYKILTSGGYSICISVSVWNLFVSFLIIHAFDLSVLWSLLMIILVCLMPCSIGSGMTYLLLKEHTKKGVNYYEYTEL
jgi:hypothetical protein